MQCGLAIVQEEQMPLLVKYPTLQTAQLVPTYPISHDVHVLPANPIAHLVQRLLLEHYKHWFETVKHEVHVKVPEADA